MGAFQPASAQEGMIGEVRLFAGNFAPRGWALCQGQLLAIRSNSALFSILGTTYGGDGRSTFGLPDLRGRVPVGTGTGPGLSNVRLGAKANSGAQVYGSKAPFKGKIDVTATITTIDNNKARASKIEAKLPFKLDQLSGKGQPALGLNYIICTQGTFPSRN